MKKNKVSVIMNCHNGEKYLRRAIKSIFDQTYSNLEIIFFDNCSNDSSAKIVKSYDDKRIKYFYSKKKLKLYEARNQAVKKAKGSYLSFLDVDDIWSKEKIKLQLNKLNKNKSNFIFTNYFIQNDIKKKKFMRSKNKLPEGKVTQSILDNYTVGINTVLMKRDIFKKFKFKNKYDIIGDFDLFIRLSLKYKFSSIQKPLVTYNIHGDNLSIKKIKIYKKELQDWIKFNEKKLLKNYNLKKIKLFLLKLRIKQFLSNFYNF